MDWFDVRGAVGGEHEPLPAGRRRSDPGAFGSPDAETELCEPPSELAERLLEGLNDAQRAAVVHGSGPLLIVAGPGSGKTRVVTSRIARLVLTGAAAPGEILALTFTNKAAREMRERLERLLPGEPSPRGLWAGTFHGICARILRRDIEVLGGYTRDFTILDTADRSDLLKKIVKDLGYDPKVFRPAAIGAWISARKNRMGEAGPTDRASYEERIFDQVEAAYERRLPELNALDFDDLLLRVLGLFDAHLGVRDAYARRFRHVLVDEYQDTNRVQYLLVRHFSSFHRELTVCGDPDQSIYGWRGADVRNILDFEKDHPSAVVVRLECNYRSTQAILDAANSLIRHNELRKHKDLFAAASDARAQDEPVQVLECGDENDEAVHVARLVRQHVARGGRFSDCAVLYRANFMQRALESALRIEAVPYEVVAGLEFYQRREIKDLVAYMRLALNPADDVAFVRAVNTPARGIGETSLARLAEHAAARSSSLAAALEDDATLELFRGRARTGLSDFRALLRRLAGLRARGAAEVLDGVLLAIGVERWLAEMDLGDGVEDRRANVEELRAYAAEFDALRPLEGARETDATPLDWREPGLRGFLADVALVADADGGAAGGDKVRLMTLHAAKGLEFPFVVVAGVEEELLPHGRALREARNEAQAIEEERRLLYVGMTRAERRLVLTYATYRSFFGSGRPTSASRFLDELSGAGRGRRGRARLLSQAVRDEPSSELLAAEALEAYAEAAAELAVGDLVQHPTFGRGRVARLQGRGIDARASVDFAQAGTRVLLLQYAKLTRLT